MQQVHPANQQDGLRVLVVSAHEALETCLHDGLALCGARVSGWQSSSPVLLDTAADECDLILFRVPHLDRRWMAELEGFLAHSPKPVVCLCESSNDRCLLQAFKAGVSGYAVGDLTVQRVSSVVKAALARFQVNAAVHKEMADLKHKLAHRALIEKAKGILMQYQLVTEEQAYQYLRKRAMDQGKKLAQVAQEVCAMQYSDQDALYG
jgi:response regulator NasT